MDRLKWRALFALATMTVVFAGCGGSAHSGLRAGPAIPRSAGCASMNCVLAGLPSPPVQPTARAAADAPVLHGVDFAWGGPRSCAAMRALGATFGASYESYDQSKGWNPQLVGAFHACGIATTVVWETTATRATRGFAAGVSDAREASRQALTLGNRDGAITFAIDFDASGPQVADYFRGVHSVLGARGNAYGGYFPILWLFQHGLVGHLNWQTYAWSRGLWLPASIAPLEQYNNISPTYDLDRAIAPNFGQWPAPAPAVPITTRWRALRNLTFRQYVKYGCKFPQQSSPCRQLGATVERVQGQLWTVYPRKEWGSCFGPKARLLAAICRVVRPEASHWSHVAATANGVYDRLLCDGPVTFPAPVHSPVCDRVRRVRAWFGGHASALVRAYS